MGAAVHLDRRAADRVQVAPQIDLGHDAALISVGLRKRCSRYGAMTVAPIALVAALRETSVLFAAVIAVIVLNELRTRALVP